MKNRKAGCQQITEDRIALYHKVILELSKKNNIFSQRMNSLENELTDAYKKIKFLTRKRWWQFWKYFTK